MCNPKTVICFIPVLIFFVKQTAKGAAGRFPGTEAPLLILLILLIFPGTFLSFLKCCAQSRLTVAGPVPFDINVLCMTLIIAVIGAVDRFTVNADRSARMLQRTLIGIALALCKAFAARIAAVAGLFAAYHNVALTAAFFFVVDTVVHTAF